MTPRSIRRAAERKARKLARKAEKQAFMQPATAAAEPEIPFPPLEPDLDWSVPAAEPSQSADEAAPFSVPNIHG